MSWHSNDNLPGKVFNVHTDVSIDTKLFTCEIRTYDIKHFFRHVPYCTRSACISSPKIDFPLIEFSQQIEGFCYQITRKNTLYHILILLQETITKLPLYVWSATSFLSFEWPKIVRENWQHAKQLSCDRLYLAVKMCWSHKSSYSTGKQGCFFDHTKTWLVIRNNHYSTEPT